MADIKVIIQKNKYVCFSQTYIYFYYYVVKLTSTTVTMYLCMSGNIV